MAHYFPSTAGSHASGHYRGGVGRQPVDAAYRLKPDKVFGSCSRDSTRRRPSRRDSLGNLYGMTGGGDHQTSAMVVHPHADIGRGVGQCLADHFGGKLSSVGARRAPGSSSARSRQSGVILVARTIGHGEFGHHSNPERSRNSTTPWSRQPARDRDVIDLPMDASDHREKMAIRRVDRQPEHGVLRGGRAVEGLRPWVRRRGARTIRVHLDHIGCTVLCDYHMRRSQLPGRDPSRSERHARAHGPPGPARLRITSCIRHRRPIEIEAPFSGHESCLTNCGLWRL